MIVAVTEESTVPIEMTDGKIFSYYNYINIVYNKRYIFYYIENYYVELKSMHYRSYIEYIQKSFIWKTYLDSRKLHLLID